MLAQLERLEALPELQARAVASILGAAVADGAARPLHWVYSQTELENILQVQRITESGGEGDREEIDRERERERVRQEIDRDKERELDI